MKKLILVLAAFSFSSQAIDTVQGNRVFYPGSGGNGPKTSGEDRGLHVIIHDDAGGTTDLMFTQDEANSAAGNLTLDGCGAPVVASNSGNGRIEVLFGANVASRKLQVKGNTNVGNRRLGFRVNQDNYIQSILVQLGVPVSKVLWGVLSLKKSPGGDAIAALTENCSTYTAEPTNFGGGGPGGGPVRSEPMPTGTHTIDH